MGNPIEEVAPNIFRIEVPLPLPGVDSVNAYVIKDLQRNLLIDTGMARKMCYDRLIANLDGIGIDLEKTDYFITHHHIDHFGLVPQLIADGAAIYINQIEVASIQRVASGQALLDFVDLLEVMGFPQKDPKKLVPQMFGKEYCSGALLPFRFISEGDKLRYGGYCFECLALPGHSSAHTCLFEADKKILIAGDAISPVLEFKSAAANPLGSHLLTLERLGRMDIDLVLPGHRPTFRDHGKRIDALLSYNHKKLQSVKRVIEEGGKTAYQGAAALWSRTDGNPHWDNLDPVRRFFLTRDYFVYMRYLEQ